MGIDPVEVAPNIYTVLFENERVRLLRVQIEPEEARQYIRTPRTWRTLSLQVR